MVVTISIPDELYQVYTKFNPQNPSKAIVKQLERFQTVAPSDKAIVLGPNEQKELVGITNYALDSASQLVEAFKKAISIDVAGVNVPLTEGQRKRLEANAKFFNKSVPEFLTARVKEAVLAHLGA